MFTKLILTFSVITVTLLPVAPAEAARHHARSNLSRVVQNTRTPPCVTCSACHSVLDKAVCANAKTNKYRKFRGVASWYGPGFQGRRTASGERFNQHALTAAHKTLPLGTRVHVRNLDNDRSVIVTINDRGPFVRSRIIDLSRGAARAIGMAGTERVELTILG